MTTKIEELEAEVRRREVLFDAARERLYRARADLAEAKGDTFHARWQKALADGDDETAHRCYLESQARHVVETGGPPYGEPSPRVMAEIAAEVERLRARASEGAEAQGN